MVLTGSDASGEINGEVDISVGAEGQLFAVKPYFGVMVDAFEFKL